MPVLKNTANTTSDARPQISSSTTSTSTSRPTLRKRVSQQVSDEARSGAMPASRRRLTSYSPMAMNGPTSRQPDAIDITYSGLLRNTSASTSAISQKQMP